MLGAIIGDIAGSVYESPENNIKTKDFPAIRNVFEKKEQDVTT